MRPPLQCFNANLYPSLRDCEQEAARCIAPIAKKIGSSYITTRCSKEIHEDNLPTANELRRIAEELPVGQERHEILCEFVLLRCCSQWHSRKLKADRTGCLDKVAESYGAEIQSLEPPPASAVRPKRLIPTDCPLFVQYETDHGDTVRSHLLKAVDDTWARSGQIYTFTWPSHPGYVKVGFTSRSSADRVEQWKKCHPGALLQKSYPAVEFPERIESLIHLEMSQFRHEITICDSCKSTHCEWFKQDIDKVDQLVEDWIKLVTTAPLYGYDRELSTEWYQRIHPCSGEITARSLLDILNKEIAQTGISRINTEAENQQENSTTQLQDFKHSGKIATNTAHEVDEELVAKVESVLVFDPNDKTLVDSEGESRDLNKIMFASAAIEGEETFVVDKTIMKGSAVPILAPAKEPISTCLATQMSEDVDWDSFFEDFTKLQVGSEHAESRSEKNEVVLPDVPIHEPIILPDTRSTFTSRSTQPVLGGVSNQSSSINR